ncbi:RNA polymerase sigma factor [Clostridium carboxidivorans P7]|uniref:RNA polymerase, sigma-24 subunit, ECF subfamily n=1 Tax=Clostridium carboxidivorans P7 TaxID=536227 RepID=C6Q2W3_9CLOT|nr:MULTISPECIES: sigma-70 family RNA polymerase sigma factor [Clostridium]AKN29517.1 RNA polymerase sigma factor [Clostridium carboxidivorans P7]EET84165.1 RNA polymerase, sigma-24 subunit, ECF subfamily [Clostridium carboxidivorans P7]EFG89558.1 putative RNA polymerase factor sigma C [Clostridium carboxidivorans P7]WPC40643.1 sigma-70 family RNA polymerase sigma factor [Clostridium sp. JS66]
MDKELERLMNDYGDDVLRIAYMYLKDKYLAEDVFQEVFIKVYKNFYKFEKRSSEKTWIMTITMNACKDILRNSWFKRVFAFDYTDNPSIADNYVDANIDNKVINSIQYEKLLNEVMNLPHKYKEPILLYYYEELSTTDISKILNVPEATIRSRLFRARKMLKFNIDGKIEYEG